MIAVSVLNSAIFLISQQIQGRLVNRPEVSEIEE